MQYLLQNIDPKCVLFVREIQIYNFRFPALTWLTAINCFNEVILV